MPANRWSAGVDDSLDALEVERSQRFSIGYFYLGTLAWAGFVLQLLLHVAWPELEAMQARIDYQIGSGALLAGYLLLQWRLPYLRLAGRVAEANRRLGEHRLIGVLGPLILYLHTSKLGVTFTWLLSVLFLGHAAAALFNIDVLRFKARWFWIAWLTLHIGLAVMVTALGVLHACTALYYE